MAQGIVETLEGTEVVPVETVAGHEIYRRIHYRELQVPKYVIIQGDLQQKDCRTLREAKSWIKSRKEEALS